MAEIRGDEKVVNGHFAQGDVCQFHVTWTCPHGLFTQTKALVSQNCSSIHDPGYQAQFERSMVAYKAHRLEQEPTWNGVSGGDPWGQQYQLQQFLEREIKKVEKEATSQAERPDVYPDFSDIKDERAQAMLKDMAQRYIMIDEQVVIGAASEIPSLQDEVHVLEAQFHQYLQDLIVTDVSSVQQQLLTAENKDSPDLYKDVRFNVDKTKLRGKDVLEAISVVNKWKLSSCPCCGGLLSTVDGVRKLADHIAGKMHTGYAAMAQQLRSLRVIKPVAMYDHPYRAWGEAEKSRILAEVQEGRQQQRKEQREMTKYQHVYAKYAEEMQQIIKHRAETQTQTPELPSLGCRLNEYEALLSSQRLMGSSARASTSRPRLQPRRQDRPQNCSRSRSRSKSPMRK